jgi:hypothetical protein
MIKTNYYALVAGFQDISLETKKLDFTTTELKSYLQHFLKPEDYTLVETLFLPIDNTNVLNKMLKKQTSFLPEGKYTEEEIDEQLTEPTYILTYLKDFVVRYKEDENTEPVDKEIRLHEMYCEHAWSQDNLFFKQWIKYQTDLKNLWIASNSHTYNYDPGRQLIKTSFSSPLYEALRKSKPHPDMIKDEMYNAEKIIQVIESDRDLITREREVDQLKIQYLDEFTFFHYFTIEKIVSYLLKHQLIERWIKLAEMHDQKMFREIIEELSEPVRNKGEEVLNEPS